MYPRRIIGDPNKKAIRAWKRENKALQYRAKSLAGGGDREIARRLKQMENK